MAEPAPEPEPAPPSAPQPRRARRVAAAAAATGAFALEHRDLLLQALELLRRTQTVTPQDEARLLAAYEQGSDPARRELAALLEGLQRANYGEVIVQLRREKDALRSELRHEGRALAREGQLLVENSKQELQRFLDQNQPTVEAVQRASGDLADAGRELASSLRFAGREFADELVQQGKRTLAGVDVAPYEQAVLDWSIETLPRWERALRGILVGVGFIFVALGGLVASALYPPARVAALLVTVGALVLVGLLLILWGTRLGRVIRARRSHLEQLARMPPAERRRWFQAKFAGGQDRAGAETRPAQGLSVRLSEAGGPRP